MLALTLLSFAALVVAVYAAHVRVQRMEFRLAAAEEVAGQLDNIMDAFAALGNIVERDREKIEPLISSLRMHSAQLKGAGVRIRKIEATLTATERNVETLLNQIQQS